MKYKEIELGLWERDHKNDALDLYKWCLMVNTWLTNHSREFNLGSYVKMHFIQTLKIFSEYI